MATRVWLLRHAQTDRPHIFHGWESDTDLSELGYRQAAALGPIIASYRPDALVSSGMVRARKTAEPIARACNLELQIEPQLHERKVGALAGTPANPELGIWPDTLRRWIEGDLAFAPPGAESFIDLQQRLLPTWQRLTTQFANRSVAVVAHGIVCRVLLLSLLDGMTVADWTKLGRIHNGSISELIHENGTWRAVRIFEVPEALRALEANHQA